LWSMTKKKKKRSSEILADEDREIFREKVKLHGGLAPSWQEFSKFSTQSENFSKIGGNLKQGEMHHGLRGMDAPVYLLPYIGFYNLKAFV